MLALSLVVSEQAVFGQVTYYWRSDSSEADGRNWQVNNNWWRGYTEAPAGSEIIIFDNNHKTEQNTNNLTATSRYRLFFNTGASSARSITGTTENVFYDYGGNVPKIENNDTGTKTLAFPIGIGYNNAEINPVSGSLTLDRLDLRTFNVNVWGNNGHTLRIRGELRGSGTGTIAIQQNSTVVIAGTPTNMGTMTINAGVLQYETTTGAGHTNTINVGDTTGTAAARLAIGAGGVTVSNRINVRSGSSGQKTIANISSGGATFSGPMTLGTSLTISNGNGGSLLFSGPVDFNAAQRIITLPTAHTATMSAALSNDGGNGLVKQGGGELILGASNNIVGLYIDAGAIRYTGTVAHVRGVIDIGPGSGSGDARLILATGGLTVTNRIESKNTTGTRNLDAVNTSGTITLSGSNLLSKELTYDVASGGTLDITGIVAGSGVLNKSGAGTMILSANNIFTGNSFVSNGVLRISHANALGTTAGNNSILAGATLEVTGSITTPEPMNVGGYGVNSNGAIRNLSGNNTLSGNIAVTSVTAIGVANASDTLTASGVISAPSATNNIIKNGAGILVLAGNNTFASQLDIQGGVLSVTSINSSASAAQPLGSRTTSPGIRLGSPDFTSASRGTFRYAGASNSVLPKTVRLAEGSEGGIDIPNDVTLTNTAEISAGDTSSWLIKSGVGRVTLEAANTYQGRTVITQGVLLVVSTSSLGNTNDSDNQATYVWPGAGMEAALEIANNVSLRERIYLAGNGISGGGALRNVSDVNTLTGRVFFSSATRINSDSGTLNLSNSTAITSAFGLSIGGSGDVVFNTPLNTGANTLLKDGSGTLTMYAVNTYSGSTTISNGALVVRGSSANSAHSVQGGATLRGAGTVGALTIFGTVDPGNSTGDRATLTSGNISMETNGAMRVDISNVSGTPGTDWDQINAGSGSVTINATAANPFTILLNGNPTGWDNTVSYSWRIVAAGSASGFATNKFTVNTSGFTPSLGGGMFSVTNSSGNLFLVFFPGTAGDIDVRGNGVIIAPGDTTPSLTDHTLFGDVLTDGGTQQRVYTITNSGSAAIGLGNISFTGGNAGDFTVINQPPATLAAGGSTNITIEFNPGADGERWTDLTFTNTVAAKSPYTFRIAGTGVTYNLDVRGNGVIIADGDATPSTTDHTDFGSIGVAGDTLTRTFTITNSGNRDLSVSNVFIIGTHASDFTVTTQPASSVAPGATTTFQVQFDPSAVGLRSAEVVFTNTSTTGKNPYNFAIQGTGAGSGIAQFPTNLSFSSVLGSLPSPAFQAFSVTNVGLGTLTYTISTNASWLYTSNNANTAASGAGNVHTAYVQYVGVMQAGTSNATITITGDSATTNSPRTIAVAWTISAIPDPTAQSATADGAELVRLAWTKNASYDVLIVHRSSNAPSAPVNGTAYNVGDTIGGNSLVIYKGAGGSLDHVVAAGSTNFYAFYSINNNYYSPGVSASVTNPAYNVLIADHASYTNGASLTGLNGGIGWGGAWGSGGGSWVVTNSTLEVPSGHPGHRANTFYVPSPGADVDVTRMRSFGAAYSTGRLYLAYTFRAGAVGTGRYLGLQFMSNSTGRLFFGLRGGSSVLGVEESVTYNGANSSYTINTATGDIYTVIGRYDFSTREMAVLGYYKTASIPVSEPGTWDATYTVPVANAPALINGLSFNMGGFGGQSLGNTWVDELRVAQSWHQLLELVGGPGFGVGPTSLVFNTSLYGTGSLTFAVTNVGFETLIFTNFSSYGSGLSGWFTASPVASTLTPYQVQVVTVALVSANITNTGTFIATNRLAGNATNSPVDVIITLNVGEIPAPSNITAAADGPQMVRLTWSKHPSYDVMIVYNQSNAPPAPLNGTNYNVGDTLGAGSRVIYKGAGSSLEHVVPAATTNFYAFYSFNTANAYSTGVVASAVTPKFDVMIVDQFSYTNGVLLGNLNGGQGWGGGWSSTGAVAGAYHITNVVLAVPTNHPGSRGNSLFLPAPGVDGEGIRTRAFGTTFSTGKVYLAYTFRLETVGANRYAGIHLMSGTNRILYYGVPGGASTLGIQESVTHSGAGSSYVVTTGTNDIHTVVGRYNFATREMAILGVYRTGTIPTSEPALWGTNYIVPVAYAPSTIDGFSLSIGAYSGGVQSNAWIDEIRVAQSWCQLWAFTGFPSVAVSPTSLTFSAMLGDVVSPTQQLAIINTGFDNLTWSIAANYGAGLQNWLSFTPASGTNSSCDEATVNVALQSGSLTNVGSFVATNTISGNATNGPINFLVSLTVSNIPPPSSLTATADGPEFVRLAWSSALPVLLVYRQDSAPTADPTNGSSYAIGDSLGGGTVIYTGTLQALEHTVRTNATHHYRIYAVNNNYYSAPVNASATTPGYTGAAIVDAFPYTNGALIVTIPTHRGVGFTGSWIGVTSTNNFTGHSQSLTAPQLYPTNGGNKLSVLDPGVGQVGEIQRYFPSFSTGRIYVAFLMQMQSNNVMNFAGTHLMQGGTRYLFIGKGGGTTNLSVESVLTGHVGVASTYYVSTGTNNNHAVVGRYDFATRELSVIGTHVSQTMPYGEPLTWYATYTVPVSDAPSYIDGIRFVVGATNPSGVGHVYFDEIRIAPTFEEVLNMHPPHATNYLVGATNGITDAALRTGNYPLQLWLYSFFGMTNSASSPDYDILNPNGTFVINDQPFTNFVYSNLGRSLQASNHVQPAVAYNDVVLGVYTMRWSAATSNGIWRFNHSVLSNNTIQQFVVFDDDTNAPAANTITSPHSGASRFMHVSSNNSAVGSVGGSSGTNIAYVLTDHYLANVVAVTSPLTLFFGASDAGSGLSRGIGGDPLYHSHLSIGSAIISNTANWDPVLSSEFTNTTTASTNAWTFTNIFSASIVSTLVNNTTFGLGTNPVVLTWRDADDDRPGDQTSLQGQQHGLLIIRDEDTTPPEFSFFGIRGATGVNTVRVDELQYGFGWWITGRVRDVGNGINVNGTSTNPPNNSPYFQLIDSTGTVRLTKAFDFLQFTDGGALVFTDGTVSNGAVAIPSLTTNDVGIWTARVVVADNDNDWGINDQLVATNDVPFTLVVGPSLSGIGRGPASLVATSYYGTLTGVSPWPNFYVTNIGSGVLAYNASVSYSGAGDWLSVSPSNAVLIGPGAITTHTVSVDTTFLAPGVYNATITLNGNQTNAAQTIAVTLTVIGFFPGEIVDQFTNATGSLEGMVGGSGWTNAWNNDPNVGFSIDSGSLFVPTNYPAAAGNKACGNTVGTELRTFRYFNAFSTGKIFMAVAVRKTDGNADGFNGISFMSNSAEVAFAGKVFNSGNFGIDLGFNGGNQLSSYGVNGTGDPGYFYVGMYDFTSNKFYGFAQYGGALPLTEPSWYVTGTPTVAIGMINGVRIAAKDEGNFCFDEVRVASSWPGLLNNFTNEPNLHASSMHFYNITTGSMTVGWVPGNGNYRIVVARESSAVTFVPTDGVSYAASSVFTNAPDFSGNRIIYNGSGTNVNLTALNPETLYHFAIFEYNTGGSPSPNYYTASGFATGQQWTLSAEPFENATNLAAYTVSQQAISNTWTVAGGSPAASGYLLLYGTNSVTAMPEDGVGYTNGQVVNGFTARIVTPGTANTVLHTNLVACTPYHFRIFSFRWNGSSAQTYNYFTSTVVSATAETLCAEPTIQASNIVFSGIGTNTITLSWDIGNGQARLVVIRGTNAVNSHPVDGTSYSASANFGSGSHLGDGNYVIFAGTGSTVTVTGLVPAVTYHFRVYEYNGAGSGVDYNTNTAVNNPRSVATIAQGLIYEGFDYGAFINMSGQSGGTGWTNSWITTGGLVESGSGNFPNFGAYPPDIPAPTRSGFIDLGNASEDTSGFRALRRNFAPFTSGKFVMALKINDNHTLATSDYLGVNLLNGSAVTAFVGKATGVADRRLSIEHNGQVRTNRIDGSNSGYQINAGTDYLIVFEYDFNTKRFSARAYVSSDLAHAMPDREAAWIVEMTNVTISKIDGIQIIAKDANQIVTFDSIRIGPSWEEVMWALPAGWHTINGPVPSLVYIGTNYGPSVYGLVVTNLSDAELTSMNLIDFAVRWNANYGGIFLTNTTATNMNIGSQNARVTPNWDPLAVGAATNEFNLDRFFTNYFGFNGSTVVTTYQKAGFNITNLDFNLQYFITVSAEAAPAGAPTVPSPNGTSWDPVPTNRAVTINYPLRFYVYDDDTNAPALGSRPLRVFTNSVIASAQSVGDLERYFVYDGVLTQAGMRVMFNIYDDYSGLQRSSSGPASTNMTITVPFVATNNFADFEPAWSSTNTLVSTATSTWSFAASLFTWTRVSAMWGGDGSGSQGQDLEVTVTAPDADADRVNDQMVASNTVAGYIRLLDDDEVPPEAQSVVFTGSTARPFFALTNLFAIGSGDTLIRGNYDRRSGTGSNTVFALTDEELAQAGSRSLQFAFGAVDAHSGVGRGTSGTTNEVMSFSLGTGILSGVITGWSPSLSTAGNGPNVIQTNIWAFTNGTFSETVITQLMAVTGPSGSGSNRVAVTIPDNDNDRQNDQERASDLTVGWLRVFDDDVKGPAMTALQVDNAYSDEAVLFTSFETTEGWPSFQASGTLWTNILTNGLGTGVWYGTGYVNLNDAAGGSRKAGFTVAGTGQYFQLPPRRDIGKVTVDARLSSGTTPRHLELQYWNGTNWASAGTNEIASPEYVSLTWTVDVPGLTTLRVMRVGVDGTPGIYMDNLLVTQSGFLNDTNSFGWTNLTSVTVRWNHATDDFSGIDEYRKVAPAIGSSVPTQTNSGSGVSGSSTSQVVSLLYQQGTITGFIFAIDNDNDRSNDRTMGNVIAYRLRIDTNPPLAVLNATNITTDPSVDETTEIKVQWTPASTNMDIAAGWRVSDSTPLSPWDTYIITVHELDGSFNPINTTVITRLNGPANLASNVTSSIVISNLNFDAYHRIRIAARDKAGNIGPEVVVTGLTVNFQVTQGISRVFSPGTNGVRLAWIASTNRVYDQLFVDAMNMTDSMSNQWNWVDRITNNFAGGNMLIDEGGYNPTNYYRVMPEQLGPTLRFYRVSLQDAWQPTNTLRRGSREVYVTKPIRLVPGENWYSAFFAPDTATVAYVFGTNRVPAGTTYATATRIHWFSPTNIGSSYNYATNTVALIGSGSGGTWMQWTGALGPVANDWVFPVNQGFMMELPVSSPTIHLPIVGRVITQQQVIAIAGAPSGSNRFHILNWNYPVRVSLTGALFRGSGMVGHNFVQFADEIRILDNTKGIGSLSQPKVRWHLRSDQTTWQLVSWSTNYYATAPTLSSFRIEPDDVVVIIRRNASTMFWTNRVYYTPPGKNFNP